MLPSKIAHKTNEIPSEKTTETLFVSNAFHYLKTLYPNLHVSLFAPSQTDEDAIGYDARFVGAGFAFEVLLQFKKADLDTDVFTMKPDHSPSKAHHKSQHQVLQGYSRRTAFYVAPTFKTYDELGKKQTIGSEEFLDHFVAVDVANLKSSTTRIKYEGDTVGIPNKVRHIERHKRDNDAISLSHTTDWLKGSELFKFFIGGVISKSGTGPFSFPSLGASKVVGSLVKFNNSSDQGIRMYSGTMLSNLTQGQILDDPNNQNGDEFRILDRDNIVNIPRPGTSGTYIFRVYNPF